MNIITFPIQILLVLFLLTGCDSGNNFWDNDILRIYQLTGKETILMWLRDKRNNWESELRDGNPPLLIHGTKLDLKKLGCDKRVQKISIYDPWQDKWINVRQKDLKINLPGFNRSLVIKIIK
jgi:hypothetical protein